MKSSRLKAEREGRGWSQAKIAKALGINTETVRRWERGLALPHPYYRERLSDLFGKTVEELGLLVDVEENDALQDTIRSSAPNLLEQAPSLLDPTIPESLGNTSNLLGRHSLLMEVKERLLAGEDVAITAVNGMPGIGKTALLAALATDQQIRQRYRDGILWAGLGSRPNLVRHFARWGMLLGVVPSQVKAINSRQAWKQAIQAAIGNRQILLIIDDAWKTQDAQALQVGGMACAHVLTTRLCEVALAFDQKGGITIDELEEADRIALLSYFVPNLVEQDPQEVHVLVQAVGGSPLALKLMGSYLASPALLVQSHPLQIALTLLQNTQESLRMSMPRVPDYNSGSLGETIPLSLHAVIAICDQQLSPQAHAALRALARFLPKPESFSQEAALAVTQQPAETLDMLCDTGLLEACGPGHYILPQAVADYARGQDQILTLQQQRPNSRVEEIQDDEQGRQRSAKYYSQYHSQPPSPCHVSARDIPMDEPFQQFSWRSWNIRSTILLTTLVIILGLLALNSLLFAKELTSISGKSQTMTAIPQATHAATANVIGTADILLKGCSKDENASNPTGRKCKLLQLTVNVKTLLPSHPYDVYIADYTCPTYSLVPSLSVMSHVQSDSNGQLSQSKQLNDGGFKPFPLTEYVCIYDDNKSHDPTKDKPVAQGLFINHSSSKPGKKGQGTFAHGTVHRIKPNSN